MQERFENSIRPQHYLHEQDSTNSNVTQERTLLPLKLDTMHKGPRVMLYIIRGLSFLTYKQMAVYNLGTRQGGTPEG